VEENIDYFKKAIKQQDSVILKMEFCNCTYIMVYDAALHKKFADGLLEEGVYVIQFLFSVGT
jgi:hypothetical protein